MDENRKLELLDLFPIATREPALRDIALAAALGQLPQSQVVYRDPKSLLQDILAAEGKGAARSAVEDALRASDIYSSWQRSMPKLKDVPNIHSFRTRARSLNDVVKVNCEIVANGAWLPKGQVLYRGGKFEACDLRIEDGPISTSLMPSVAYWHAHEVGGAVAILHVMDESTAAFVFKSEGSQWHALEFEVLVQNEIELTFKSEFIHADMRVVEFELRPLRLRVRAEPD